MSMEQQIADSAGALNESPNFGAILDAFDQLPNDIADDVAHLGKLLRAYRSVVFDERKRGDILAEQGYVHAKAKGVAEAKLNWLLNKLSEESDITGNDQANTQMRLLAEYDLMFPLG